MRHKKIPGKKHKGYKDPEVQHAKRNEQLSQKVGSKQSPYKFTQIKIIGYKSEPPSYTCAKFSTTTYV